MLPARRILAVAAAALLAPAAAHADAPSTYQVGIGTKSIAVQKDGSFGGGKVYLGGFGIGGPTAAGVGIQDRHATGNLGVGPSVRAFVVSDGKTTFAIADAEVQGWFAADRDGPLGIIDARRAIAAATKGAITADHIVIQSDHTHGGPDLLGVWGGASTAYRKYVLDQTVAAVKEAYDTRKAGTLVYGTAPARDLINNQFDYDRANKVMDSELRVMQARDAHGRPFATMLNLSSHADVLGSSNTLATGDWPQQTNLMLERELGGQAMTVVGTLGRSQPNRPGCSFPQFKAEGDALCSLDSYSKLVVDRTKVALADARPLTGKAIVAANSYLIVDPASNPALLGLMFGGAAIGAPLYRAVTPPFLTGTVLGTSASSVRIGDVLLSAGPGEMYPQIPLKVRGTAEQVTAGIRGFMTAGLANDQLGYIIAPYEAYPEPIKTSFFDRSFANRDQLDECAASYGANCDPSTVTPTPDPIGNDNYFFNVSHTMGERLTCALLRGAGEVFDRGTDLRDAYDRCATFASDAALPEGADVTAADAAKDAPAVPATIPPAVR
ncbi:MAG: hypothetical protein QOG68_1890 [Solirubrobacteraceae bacterium]|nr:hypothetical protein [Solirubrobacteraceae bacterium]